MDDVLCFPLHLHTKLEGFIVHFPELAAVTAAAADDSGGRQRP